MKSISKNGFTLVETIMAAAVGMIVISGITAAMTSMVKMQAKSDLSTEAALALQDVADTLKSGAACTGALQNKTLDVNSPQEVSVGPMMVSGTSMTLAQDNVVRPGLTFASVKLLRNPSVPGIDVVTASQGTYKQYLAVLRLQLAKTNLGSTTKSPPVDIPLKLMVDASNVIQLCNTDTSDGRVCIESGGKWDPTKPDGFKCTPKSMCEFAGGYSMPAPGGTGIVNPITQSLSCPAGFLPVRSGSTATAARCGKYCIGNQFSADFTCARCGSDFNALAGTATAITPDIVPVCDTSSGVPVCDYSADVTAVAAVNTQITTAQTVAQVPPAPTPAPTPISIGGACSVSTVSLGGLGGGSLNLCTCGADSSMCSTCTGGKSPDCPLTSTIIACFIAGTQVTMADHSLRSIESIVEGDKILSYNEKTGTPYISTVTRALRHEPHVETLYDVFTADGHNFVANGIHNIFVIEKNRYLAMRDIYELFRHGHRLSLLSDGGVPLEIQTVRAYENSEALFNLHVNGISDESSAGAQGTGHNYFAGGVLVHNMKTAPSQLPIQ